MKKRTYKEAAHAMQSGVAFIMQKDPSETNPKHLRVGINSAFCSITALVRLLIKKGVITEAEYFEANTEEMNAEADRYQDWVNSHLGGNTTLH